MKDMHKLAKLVPQTPMLMDVANLQPAGRSVCRHTIKNHLKIFDKLESRTIHYSS